jgi:hypothetical protein
VGGARKKLTAWCRFEFGRGVGDAPGNCDRCQKHFQLAKDGEHAEAVQRAERDLLASGRIGASIELPVLAPTASTPCDVCPKMALWPMWEPGQQRGLDPANNLAVQLYYYAREDQRVGVFDSAPLMRTVTVPGIRAVLDEFEIYMPTWLHRQNMFTKILMIDQVATDVRFEQEERQRKAREMAAKASSERDASRENRGG